MPASDISLASAASPPLGRRAFGSRIDAGMVVVNLVGMLLYLRLASASWAIPAERAAGITSVTGEPFVWAVSVVPVWGACLLANAAWLGFSLQRRGRLSVPAWAVVVLGWVASIAIDFARH